MTECYECARLAELVAENSQLRVKVAEHESEERRMAPHDCGHIADMSQKSADCVRSEPEMSENIGSDLGSGSQVCSEVDTREKLEADVRNAVKASGFGFGTVRSADRIIGWLDRQEAITERECADTRVNFAERMRFGVKIDELQAKVVELTEQLETAHAKNRLLKAHISKMQVGRHGWHVKYPELEKKNAELQAKVDELTAERDQWREAAGNAHAMWEKADNERNELKRKEKQLSNELGLRDKAIELLQDVKQELIEERDELKRENAKLSSDEFYLRCTMVDMNGEVVG